MKNAKDIVKSIQLQPQFEKLHNFRCIERILSMFLPALRRFVDFCYIKNDTLFIVLNHNAGKQEFDNSIKMIKDVLKTHNPQECEGVGIKDIKTFVTHKPRRRNTLQTKALSQTVPHYKERAKGEFDTERIKDESLRSIVEEIRSIIQKRVP